MFQPTAIEKVIFYNLMGVKAPLFLFDEKEIKDLKQKGFVEDEGFYLKGKVLEKYSYNKDLVDVVLSKSWIFRFLPFVRQVGVCNSLAIGNSDAGSDIDLFLVVDHERFFTARFFTSFIFQVLGKRRYGEKVAGRFCLSFWVSDRCLNMSDLLIDDDYYFKFWLNNIWWLLDDCRVVDMFLEENTENIFRSYQSSLLAVEKRTSWFEKIMSGRFGNVLEGLLEKYQMERANKKYKQKKSPKGVVLRRGVFKCHDKDIRWDFRDRFRRFLSSL